MVEDKYVARAQMWGWTSTDAVDRYIGLMLAVSSSLAIGTFAPKST